MLVLLRMAGLTQWDGAIIARLHARPPEISHSYMGCFRWHLSAYATGQLADESQVPLVAQGFLFTKAGHLLFFLPVLGLEFHIGWFFL